MKGGIEMIQKKKNKIDTVSLLFVAPAFIIYTIFIIVPVIQSIPYSLAAWDGISEYRNFIGLENYVNLFKDERFFNALKNTLLITLLFSFFTNVIAIFLAVLLDQIKMGKNLLRSLFFIPVLLSSIIIGFIWSIMYNYNFGVINTVLDMLYLSDLSMDWVGNPKTVILAIVNVVMWQFTGYYMVIYLAALQSMPTDVLEAARIDGANKWQVFKNITFPLLAGAMTVNFTLALFHGMKVFGQVAVLTDGGPGFKSETLAYFVYKVGFGSNRQGYGSAAALMLFIVILILTVIQNRYLRNREVEM